MNKTVWLLWAVVTLGCAPELASERTGGERSELSATAYRVGAARVDITGPFVGSSTGYNSPGEELSGLGMRLYARTFVIEDARAGSAPVALVTADMVHSYQSVKLGVVKALAADGYGQVFRDENVLLAATHTHSAPSNISWYTLFNLFNGVAGFDALHYRLVVRGIADSIEQAYEARTPATIRLARGTLPGATSQRSRPAYDTNVDAAAFEALDPTMTLLRFDAVSGAPIGVLDWFGVHGTSLGIDNRRAHGDNKGFAAYAFEQQQGAGFVAAFAQSVFGDVSPNAQDPADPAGPFLRPHQLDPSLDPLESPIVHGQRQLEAALALHEAAGAPLAGPVDVRHSHVSYNELQVHPDYIGNRTMPWDLDAGRARTCVAALGAGFLSGDEEGAPVDVAPEGTLRNHYTLEHGVWDLDRLVFSQLDLTRSLVGDLWPLLDAALATTQYDDCHKEKFVILPVGDVSQFWLVNPRTPFVPVHLPLQIVRIGSLALVATPFEPTTMTGRRIEAALTGTLAASGIDTLVVAGMANAYAQYLTTREEYGAQHFEGAFTAWGPWAAAATVQELDRLAQDLVAGRPSDPGVAPPDLSGQQYVETPASRDGVPLDAPAPGHAFGDVLHDAAARYDGQHARVVVTFQGANPRGVQELRVAGTLGQYVDPARHTYLEVQREQGGSWVAVADDADPYTAFDFVDKGGLVARSSEVTVTWLVRGALPGRYRIVYHGIARTLFGRVPFTGTSSSFEL